MRRKNWSVIFVAMLCTIYIKCLFISEKSYSQIPYKLTTEKTLISVQTRNSFGLKDTLITLPSKTASEQKFYSDLEVTINKAIAGIYHTKITPIAFPSQGDFMWYYQNINQVLNEGTFNYISARVSPGSIPGTAQISSAGGFPNAYIQLISSIKYTLSQADQTKLNVSLSHTNTQAQSIVSKYQEIFGEITVEELKKAQNRLGDQAVLTKIDYVISYVLGSQWSGRQEEEKLPLTYKEMANAQNLKDLLPKMPVSGEPVVTELSIYLALMQSVNILQSEIQMGNWIVRQMINNTSHPTRQNGGMQTVNPNTGAVSQTFQVGYSISRSLASIENHLNNKQQIIKVDIRTSEKSSTEVMASIAGLSSFFFGSVLRFSQENSFDDNMQMVQGSSKDSLIEIKYPGYTMVPIEPLAWQQATNIGWYYEEPIAEAYKNGTQDVTGFKFVLPPNYNLNSLADGGDFGQLTSLLISNYPTVTILYQNADFKKFKQSWDQNRKGNLTLFGFNKIGSFSKGIYSSQVHPGSSNSEFSVIFSPSPEVVSIPELQKMAYVIGGTFNFPAINTSKVSLVRRIIAKL
ncbi:hypothetical protein [Nostoc favosum]|uniref:Uncharacterized protein n=1 Tax=Nostoc favosum CHAB5714 TaxID=2780399 RepID=A0ABS8IIJ7_9NOSO|nr:hypothetical protein [Nostoc favosum]MCC5603629.1 hypothetical protein [Nostoc favosum CHAB5714]